MPIWGTAKFAELSSKEIERGDTGRAPNLPIWGNTKFADLSSKEMERGGIPEGFPV